MKRFGLWIIPLMLFYAAGSGGADTLAKNPENSPPAGSRSESSVNAKLVGSWRLVSWVARQPDGTVKHTMGADPIGFLIYDGFGNMSVQIMDSFRPGFERGYAGTTLEELKSIHDGYLAYFGTYVIDEKQHAVVHRIKAITNPNYYGADLVRYYELSGDRLVLSLDKDKLNSLTWARIKE